MFCRVPLRSGCLRDSTRFLSGEQLLSRASKGLREAEIYGSWKAQRGCNSLAVVPPYVSSSPIPCQQNRSCAYRSRSRQSDVTKQCIYNHLRLGVNTKPSHRQTVCMVLESVLRDVCVRRGRFPLLAPSAPSPSRAEVSLNICS